MDARISAFMSIFLSNDYIDEETKAKFRFYPRKSDGTSDYDITHPDGRVENYPFYFTKWLHVKMGRHDYEITKIIEEERFYSFVEFTNTSGNTYKLTRITD